VDGDCVTESTADRGERADAASKL